jgi:hypothetical protein
MGEILKFDPLKRKKEEKKPEDNRQLEIDIGDDLRGFIKTMGESDPGNLLVELILSGVNVGEKIEEIIKNTKGYDPNIYLERKKDILSYSNSQLIKEFAKSNHFQWHKYPAFYRAVVNEVQERIRMLTKSDK